MDNPMIRNTSARCINCLFFQSKPAPARVAPSAPSKTLPPDPPTNWCHLKHPPIIITVSPKLHWCGRHPEFWRDTVLLDRRPTYDDHLQKPEYTSNMTRERRIMSFKSAATIRKEINGE